MPESIRAAAIGATGRGNYGHGLDVVFSDMPGVEFVAIADENPDGLRDAGKRTGVRRLYADYRELLAKEKPDVVSIGPRWTDQRREMVTAAAEAGCAIFSEKPFARNPADADAMLAACQSAGVPIAVAHQNRALPPIRKVRDDLKAGRFGKLLRMRARGKEDQRGGGEDLLVLGTHLLDLMIFFAGPPQWVGARVAVGERDATLDDAKDASEGVGKVAGDDIAAAYGFAAGVLGFFESRKGVARDQRVPFLLQLECEEATIQIRDWEAWTYPSSVVLAAEKKLEWSKVWVEDWHFKSDHSPWPASSRLGRANRILVEDLLAAAKEKREPMASGADARTALEMILGVYTSHLAGGKRTIFPLVDRRHPLDPPSKS